MKHIVISLTLLTLLSISAVAQEASSGASPTPASEKTVLLKKGDFYIGPRVALGAVAGASFGLGAAAEYGLDNNIGIGAFAGYSSYSEAFSGFGGSYKWSYKNILLLATGSYHYDVLKNDKLDTWGEVGLGYNIGSVSYEGPSIPGLIEPTAGGFVYTITANARYFFSSNLAFFASVGYGLGIARVGVDFKL
jgi:hypothetical protein